MRTRLDSDLEQIQRQARLRRIGRDLYDLAESVSPETVESAGVVVLALEASTDYGTLIADGFAKEMLPGDR